MLDEVGVVDEFDSVDEGCLDNDVMGEHDATEAGRCNLGAGQPRDLHTSENAERACGTIVATDLRRTVSSSDKARPKR